MKRYIDVDGIPVRVVNWSAFLPGVDGMTLPRVILLRPRYANDAHLLSHELEHVRQWRHHGVVGFLRRYLSDYLQARLKGCGHVDAYLGIRFECEARDAADRQTGQK